MKLKNRKIWITGASSGIGEALALQLAKDNQLILTARNQQKLNAVLKVLPGRGHAVYPMDVTADSVLEETASMIRVCGLPDVSFLNAGISQRALVANADPAIYKQIMDVNFFGAVHPFSVLLKHKPLGKRMQVVVTNSVAGKFGYWLRSGYAASKHALTGFFDVAQLEQYQDGLRITQVFPGRIDTPINANAIWADGQPSGERQSAFKNAMQPEKVAKKMIRAAERERHHKVIAELEWIPFLVYRLSKKLFFKVFSKQEPQ